MASVPKVKRKADRALLDSFHGMRCVVCQRHGCDPCHVKSKGSGGSDSWENVIALCRQHHSEQHQIGWAKFCGKYPRALLELEARGWSLDEANRLRMK